MNPSSKNATSDSLASIQTLSAVTLATTNMARSVAFYVSLGFVVRYGGPHAAFTTLRSGESCLNLVRRKTPTGVMNWGRLIFYVDDVDSFHARVVKEGWQPETESINAAWGERYFHLRDPDGHSLSFAAPFTKAFMDRQKEDLVLEIESARMEARE